MLKFNVFIDWTIMYIDMDLAIIVTIDWLL